MKTMIFCVTLVVCLLGINVRSAFADLLINMSQVYNGATPSGVGAWGTAKFEDVTTGEVLLTMTNLLNSPTEYLAAWYFNLDPAFKPKNLVFTHVSGQAAKKITNRANNTEPPGQGGDFDISFAYESANNVNRFKMDETSVYKIKAPGITSSSFKWFSENENNSFVSVIAIRGIPINPYCSDTLSGEVAGTIPPASQAPVPELGSMCAWGGIAGMVGLVSFLRQRRRRSDAV
ncbi:MAG: hypothetical protein SFX18_04940 [Pirellulales bacterium]|nr:hypothetical protein [Pirellulales bacterium]